MKIFLVVFMALYADQCSSGPVVNSSEENKPAIIDKGEGVFYFDVVKKNFNDELVKFRKERPQLRIISIADDSATPHGQTLGYWVVTEPVGRCVQ
ncbi:hypothetical protein IPM19_01155 [bacterium]|nr:MAG: hypothetical protein IPM19_01155 [bacterium]